MLEAKGLEAAAKATFAKANEGNLKPETIESLWPSQHYPHWSGLAQAAISAYLEAVGGEPVGWFNPWNDYHGYQQVAKEFEGSPGTIPLYAAPQAPAVKVKGLEWVPVSKNGRDVQATTPFGPIYTISVDAPSAGGAAYLWCPQDGDDDYTLHASMREAKAAAQADYERRSALEAETGGGETPPSGKWEIDNSTGTPILVYDKCSVIESEQAYYLLGLIQRAGTTTDERAVEALDDVVDRIAMLHNRISVASIPSSFKAGLVDELKSIHQDIRAALAQGESRNG